MIVDRGACGHVDHADRDRIEIGDTHECGDQRLLTDEGERSGLLIGLVVHARFLIEHIGRRTVRSVAGVGHTDDADEIALGDDNVAGLEIAAVILLIDGDRFRILVRVDILDGNMTVRFGFEARQRFREHLEVCVLKKIRFVCQNSDLDVIVQLVQEIDRLIVNLIETLRGQVDVPVVAAVEHAADHVDRNDNRNHNNRNDCRERAVLELLAALDAFQCALFFRFRCARMLFLLGIFFLVLLVIGGFGSLCGCLLLLCIFLQRIGCGQLFFGGFQLLLDFFFFAHHRIPPQLQRLRSNTRIVR